MSTLTQEASRRVGEIANRYGVSFDAATTLLHAVAAGGGSMAQFSHPELGGMGQWSPGMTMVGDMFNQGLKQRVEGLCSELAGLVREASPFASAGSSQFQSQGQPGMGFGFSSGNWWPQELGAPSSSGGQNDMRYAYFPSAARLAVQQNGRLSVHDTGSTQIFGVSQQQGGSQSLTFSTDRGTVRLEDFPLADAPGNPGFAPQRAAEPAPAFTPEYQQPPAAPSFAPGSGSSAGGDPLAMLERLADLHARGVLTAEEFAAKKADLLGRL